MFWCSGSTNASSHCDDSELGGDLYNGLKKVKEEATISNGDENSITGPPAQNYYGKTRFKWICNPPVSNLRYQAHHLTFQLSRVIGPQKILD